jgi:hypothetical protein
MLVLFSIVLFCREEPIARRGSPREKKGSASNRLDRADAESWTIAAIQTEKKRRHFLWLAEFPTQVAKHLAACVDCALFATSARVCPKRR